MDGQIRFCSHKCPFASPLEEKTKLKVPEYIRRKMHRAANLHAEASVLMRQIDEWFERRGYSMEDLRCGDGFSLEELDYGNDVTDAFCARVESGEFLDHQRRDEEPI